MLLQRALDDGRILVTEDKDFGELVFGRQMQHSTIVRFVQLQVEEQLEAMRELLEGHAEDLAGSAVIVVSKGRIRIRQRPE